MKYIMRFCLVSLIIITIPFIASAEDLMAQADAIFQKKGLENFKSSSDIYLKILQSDPQNYDANWKYVRSIWCIGDYAKTYQLEEWKKICAENGKKGMMYAQKAIDLEHNKPDGYYFYGLSVGLYADGISIIRAGMEGLKDKTQNSLEKVYELDKAYDHHLILVSLGRYWQILPWPYKDNEKAMKYYREFQATPAFWSTDEPPYGPVYLAELLIDMGGKEKKKEAKKILEKVETNNKFWKNQVSMLLTKIE